MEPRILTHSRPLTFARGRGAYNEPIGRLAVGFSFICVCMSCCVCMPGRGARCVRVLYAGSLVRCVRPICFYFCRTGNALVVVRSEGLFFPPRAEQHYDQQTALRRSPDHSCADERRIRRGMWSVATGCVAVPCTSGWLHYSPPMWMLPPQRRVALRTALFDVSASP